MKVLKSTLDDILRDIPKLAKCNEDAIGYFVADKDCILDCIWHNNKEVLPDVRYNDTDIDVYRIPVSGGTIVLRPGDIGFLHITTDVYSRWEIAVMQEIRKHLFAIYKIPSEIIGNDLLINNKKFAGVANGFINKRRVSAIFVSMNDTTKELIDKIRTKPMQHDGFVGLYRYRVDANSLIRKVVFFSKRWEDEAI